VTATAAAAAEAATAARDEASAHPFPFTNIASTVCYPLPEDASMHSPFNSLCTLPTP